VVNPVGINDTCATPSSYPDAGSTCPNGNGLYCGQTLGLDPHTLYDCEDGTISAQQSCPGACEVQPAGTPDSCGCANGDGLYCGTDGLGLNANTLYRCTSGQITVAQVCSSACLTEPSGTSDQCAGGCPVGASAAGTYCGSDLAGGTGLDANTLYSCDGTDTVPTSATPCSGGCQANPPGTPDACKAATCPNGDGLYCGNDGLGLSATTLYQCQAGAISAVESCSHACVSAAGSGDHCDSCPAGDGLYCGGDGLGLDPNTLYSCTAGVATVSQACGAPCQVAPAGQADACPGGGCSVASQAALSWESSQLSQGNSWSDLCLGFVNNAFTLGAGVSLPELSKYDAADALAAVQAEGKLQGWDGSCPCGAILFWSANSCNGSYGHIVICNGDGTVSTSGWPGFAGSSHATIAWLEGEECNQPPAGTWQAE
jgi:hypothetical protein